MITKKTIIKNMKLSSFEDIRPFVIDYVSKTSKIAISLKNHKIQEILPPIMKKETN